MIKAISASFEAIRDRGHIFVARENWPDSATGSPQACKGALARDQPKVIALQQLAEPGIRAWP